MEFLHTKQVRLHIANTIIAILFLSLIYSFLVNAKSTNAYIDINEKENSRS